MFHDCIIMAGGSGTRLWPASSSKKPKQFLPAPGGGSFFSASVKRALEIIDPASGRIIIISGKDHVNLIAEACAGFTESERRHMVLVPEPEAKNTAPAIACGLRYNDWESGGMDRNILVLTSDHIIEPLSVFKANAEAAAAFAQQDKLVIFGIFPQRPETGYGYIEAGEALPLMREQVGKEKKHFEPAVYKVVSFTEKPDAKKAVQYLEAGNYFWNSGMFGFSSKFMLGEFRRLAADVLTPFNMLRAPCEWHYKTINGLRVLSDWLDLDKAYAETKAISFDYAIAEKAASMEADASKEAGSSILMIKADFDWTDVGNWDEYMRLPLENTSKAEVFRKDSESVLVDSDISVALIGVEDLIVVIRSGKDGGPAAAIIAKKGETQKVKDIVEQLKSAGRIDLV